MGEIRTGSSTSSTLACPAVVVGASYTPVGSSMGIRAETASGASRSKVGRNAKSIVLESRAALKPRLALKHRKFRAVELPMARG